MNPREVDFQAKKEGDPNCSNISKIPSSSKHWSTYKNPRIVRVSRCFGGKDRHSKVCTVKGLRDRRIRLSVPTAIQLYDLQNKLGLNQPSKVVDWLLNATKCDIDELPPLPKLPINLTHLTHQLLPSHQSEANPPSHFLSSNDLVTNEGTKVDDQTTMEKGKWNAISHNHQETFGGYAAQLSAQSFFPLGNQSSFLNMPYNPYFHLDPSSLPFFPNQTLDDPHLPLNNLLASVPPLNSQLYFCPSAATVPSLIHSSTSNDSRHINHLSPTTLNLNTPPMTTSELPKSL